MTRSVLSTFEEPPTQNVIRDVLIVDDSRAQRRVASLYLKSWGFTVREAECADYALTLCAQAPPDLVLSDWMMPGLSGPEFCREFRKIKRDTYGYFILLTSKNEKNDIAHGLDAGADDFLTKPISAPELRARISAGERILRMERELTRKNHLVQATLRELQALYDSLDTDLLEAKRLQQSLVRDRYHDFGFAEVSLILQSSGHVGGDLVGMFPITEKRIGLYAIDVSGHGVSSALMTARLAGYLSGSAPDQNVSFRQRPDGTHLMRPPSQTIAHLNRLILSEMETEHYFTMILADVHLDSGRIILSQAGHPHPVVQRACGKVELIGSGGLPVGLVDGATYEDFEIRLTPGDRLVLYSDGIIEMSDENGQLLGDDGFAALLTSLRQTHGMALLESVIWKLTEYAGDRDFADDVSAVLLEFKPSPCGV